MSFWPARNRAVQSIDNNQGLEAFRASSVGVSAQSPTIFSPHRAERRSCRRGRSKDLRLRERALPKRAQNWGQAALLAHKNRELSTCRVLQKPARADMHRTPRDYLLA